MRPDVHDCRVTLYTSPTDHALALSADDHGTVLRGPRDVGRLLVACPDRAGIVAAVTTFLAEQGANIVESQQYSTDPSGGEFFLRLEFVLAGLPERLADLAAAFAPIARQFSMDATWTLAARVKRLALFVSRTDHALLELLWRTHSGDLAAEVAMVISNHPELERIARSFDVPFHHIPVTASTRDDAERRQLKLVTGAADVVVLARYMQILSPTFLRTFPGRIINIHHSFLPAFVGADPYRAAHERGVKLIGATAHYVTEELDAGPIIEQDVQRVDHRHTVEELRRLGRLVERTVLARAVTWHVQDRVLVHGNSTIVFS